MQLRGTTGRLLSSGTVSLCSLRSWDSSGSDSGVRITGGRVPVLELPADDGDSDAPSTGDDSVFVDWDGTGDAIVLFRAS